MEKKTLTGTLHEWRDRKRVLVRKEADGGNDKEFVTERIAENENAKLRAKYTLS